MAFEPKSGRMSIKWVDTGSMSINNLRNTAQAENIMMVVNSIDSLTENEVGSVERVITDIVLGEED